MMLENALPNVFARSIPKIQPESSVSNAISILLSVEGSVLPIESPANQTMDQSTEQRSHARAISGYSIISRLVETDPKDYEGFLSAPCRRVALTIGTVSYERDDIQSLLHVFESSTFGYASVESSSSSRSKMGGIILIRDLLPLFNEGILKSDLVVSDVATSQVFGMPRDSSVKSILKEMLNRKFRRVLMKRGEKSELVTEKEIMRYLFGEGKGRYDSSRLEELMKGKLDGEEASFLSVARVHGGAPLREAANVISKSKGHCALSDAGIITPWDLIIKPWRLGQLSISK